MELFEGKGSLASVCMATQILTVAIISGDKAKHITVGIGEADLRLRVNTDSDMQSRQSGTDSDSTDCPGVIHIGFRLNFTKVLTAAPRECPEFKKKRGNTLAHQGRESVFPF